MNECENTARRAPENSAKKLWDNIRWSDLVEVQGSVLQRCGPLLHTAPFA
jgi:hypothetical protein